MATPEPDLLTPYLPDNPVMAYMWVGCLQWAMKQPGCLEEFRADTGFTWTPGRTPLDRMIDDATGMPRAFLDAFLPWFNEHVWGDEHAPLDP
jgi:hypothetical protein